MRRERDIRIGMTRAEKELLEKLAGTEGMSQAAIVRRLLRAEGRKQGLWPARAAEPTREEVPGHGA